MPADQGDAERFAAATERGLGPRAVGDPELARDLEIAAMLRRSAPSLTPREDERARVRARVMAQLSRGAAGGDVDEETIPIAPVLRLSFPDVPSFPDVAEPTVQMHVVVAEVDDADPEPVPAAVTPLVGRARRGGRHGMAQRGRRRPTVPRRVLVAGAAALVAGVAIAGGGVYASRDALPGDALYGVKRVAESVGNALTVGDAARAQRRLDAATTRLDEVQSLVARDASAPLDPTLVQSAIQDFDSSTGAGSRALLDTEDAGGPAALDRLRAWAADAATRLAAMRAALPASARTGVDSSIGLLDRLAARAKALAARSGCAQVTSGTVDDLGPLPATGPCTPRHDGGDASTSSGGTGSGTRDGTPTGGSDATATPNGSGGILPPFPAVVGGSGGPGGAGGSSQAPTNGPAPTTTTAPPLINLPPLLPGGPGIHIG